MLLGVILCLACWVSLFGWLPQESFLRSRLSDNKLGAVVVLGPPRNEITYWEDTSRFCFLMRAVRSIDLHLNRHYGPYTIYILVAKDYMSHPRNKDGPYTQHDRDLIRSWAPNSEVIFIEIDLYSNDALEPNTTVEQIVRWRKGEDGGTEGRDLGYQSMCRLWSGRLQTMEFLRKYTYYLRMDDDSLLTEKLMFDPFQQMYEHRLNYAWRRDSAEIWGINKLKTLITKHITITDTTPFMSRGEYYGSEPYNNFHVSRVSFWSSPKWQAFWRDLNDEHAFFKYRLGDANVHAAAIMMMPVGTFTTWPTIPYVHNTNDMRKGWAPKSWKLECEAAETNIRLARGLANEK
jgi:Glycolipid 2-alpha-mannosyltransferase